MMRIWFRLMRLYHTVKYLKVTQLFYRVFYRYKKVKIKSTRHVPAWRSLNWHSPAYKDQSVFENGMVEFLSISAVVNQDIWNSPNMDLLWLYNLHYFDDLNAVNAKERESLHYHLINLWLSGNPVDKGCGWDAYTISLRLVNWIKWFCNKDSIKNKYLASLHLQAEVLYQKIEYHILANHLFANAKALIFVGSFFDNDEGKKYLQKGLQIIDAEIQEQFLKDGSHFELSPMYHSIMIWDLCDLVNLAKILNITEMSIRVSSWSDRIEKGLVWLEKMIHPDGEIAFFNDCAFGVGPNYSQLCGYAEYLDLSYPKANEQLENNSLPTVKFFESSGYAVADLGGGNRLIADVAKVGPNYQPGHAHADTLSFELSLFAQRIFVNSGISMYGEGVERHNQRSTFSHNTVAINGENSSEVWSGFRVARRAFPKILDMTNCIENGTVSIKASHDGYKRLKNNNVHEREWIISNRRLEIRDKIHNRFDTASSYLYLHPDICVSKYGMNEIILTTENGECVKLCISGGNFEVIDGNWYPYFGQSIKNSLIRAEFNKSEINIRITW